MARPITADRMLEILKAEGLTVREVPGWRDRCRCCPDNAKHRPAGPYVRSWGDVVGTLTHITAGNLGKRTPLQYIQDIINGDKKTPTKAQFVPDPDGVVWINSVGRCNHAGQVGSQVKAHLRLADFRLDDSHDDRFDGSGADGNAFTYGIENIAAKTMTAAQREASVRINAAIARELGWTGQESVGHGEVSAARVYADPNLDMGKFRRDVMARVKAGPGGTKPPTPPPSPPVVQPATTHVVAPGDTLGRIAKANRLDVDDLAAWNGIADKDVIRVGQLLTLVKPDVVPPVCPVPDPAEPTPPTSTITYVTDTVVVLNGAGYNAAHGKATALKRLPAMVKSLKADRPAVMILVEWSRPMLATADKLMTGYTRGILPGRDGNDANGAGREIYVRDDMEILAVVKGDVKTKLQLSGEAKPDDKPLLAVVYRPKGGLPRLATAFHNENQDGRDVKTKLDADTIRVRQIREGLQFSIDVADDHSVPYYNIDHGGDGNSYGWALDEAERMNWKSALESATTKGDDVALRTHNNWDDARVKAGHFDLGLVRHYVDVVEGDQTFDPKLSDHNQLTYSRKYQLTRA